MVAHTHRLSQMVSVRGETEFERFWRLLAIFAAFEATYGAYTDGPKKKCSCSCCVTEKTNEDAVPLNVQLYLFLHHIIDV